MGALNIHFDFSLHVIRLFHIYSPTGPARSVSPVGAARRSVPARFAACCAACCASGEAAGGAGGLAGGMEVKYDGSDPFSTLTLHGCMQWKRNKRVSGRIP
jgi:hypothetical protein